MPITALISIAVATTAFAQSESAPDATAVALAQDWSVLKRAYTELHPGLLRYNTASQLEGHFASLQRAWSKDQSLSQAYLHLSEFLAKIKCGHTYANFFNQDVEIRSQLFDKRDKVPFAFRWIQNRMIVTRDATIERAFPRGTEVLRINKMLVGRILQRMLQFARADGNNQAKRIDFMEVLGEGKYEAFDIYYPLAFPLKGENYTFEVRRPGESRSQIVTAKPIKMEDRTVPGQEMDRKLRLGPCGTSSQMWPFSRCRRGPCITASGIGSGFSGIALTA